MHVFSLLERLHFPSGDSTYRPHHCFSPCFAGPGMVEIPGLFQDAGWLMPTITFIWIGLQAGITSMLLAKAISQIPGNKQLRHRFEFGNLTKILYPRWLYLIMFFALVFNLQAQNISSIVISAQTMDNTLLYGPKKTCALVLYNPDHNSDSSTVFTGGPGFRCLSEDFNRDSTDSPFNHAYVVSLGYLITLAVTIPLGYLNLEDNIWVQIAGFLLLLMCILVWCYQFLFVSTPDWSGASMPVFNKKGFGSVLSTVIFNWGFITTVPSWFNEKGPQVSTARATWISVVFSLVTFLLLGTFGAVSLKFTDGNHLLTALMSESDNPGVIPFAKICTFIFPTAALLSGIPVFSIIVRYNILENKVMNKFWANLFAVVLPWAVALIFFPGNALNDLIEWSSALLFVVLNFALPAHLYILLNTASGRRKLIQGLRAEGMLDEEALLSYEDKARELKERGPGFLAITADPNAVDYASKSTVKSEKSLLGSFTTVFSSKKVGDDEINAPLLGSSSADNRIDTASATEDKDPEEVKRVIAAADIDEFDFRGDENIHEFPSWWPKLCGVESYFKSAKFWFWVSIALAIASFILQIVGATQSEHEQGGDEE